MTAARVALALGLCGAATMPDAGEGDASEGGPLAPNLLVNGNFENGCAPWVVFPSGVIEEVTIARSGAKSCRLCGKPGQPAGRSAVLEEPRPRR